MDRQIVEESPDTLLKSTLLITLCTVPSQMQQSQILIFSRSTSALKNNKLTLTAVSVTSVG